MSNKLLKFVDRNSTSLELVIQTLFNAMPSVLWYKKATHDGYTTWWLSSCNTEWMNKLSDKKQNLWFPLLTHRLSTWAIVLQYFWMTFEMMYHWWDRDFTRDHGSCTSCKEGTAFAHETKNAHLAKHFVLLPRTYKVHSSSIMYPHHHGCSKETMEMSKKSQ